jgi:hypothetical protein
VVTVIVIVLVPRNSFVGSRATSASRHKVPVDSPASGNHADVW